MWWQTARIGRQNGLEVVENSQIYCAAGRIRLELSESLNPLADWSAVLSIHVDDRLIPFEKSFRNLEKVLNLC
jgi:hypothetical protein